MAYKTQTDKPYLSQRDIPYLLFLAAIDAAAIALGFRLYAKLFPDSFKYLLLVQWFRGQLETSDLIAPFSYRPLVPLVVSILPFDPLFGFYIVNSVSLVCLSFLLYLICRHFGFARVPSTIAISLCMMSHPVMGYGTAVLVDTVAMMMIALGALLIVRPHTRMTLWFMIGLTVLSVSTRETTAATILAYLFYTGRKRDAFVLGTVAVATYVLIRWIFSPPDAGIGFVWSLSLYNFTVRPFDTARMLLLGLGILFPITVVGAWTIRKASWFEPGPGRWLWAMGIPMLLVMFSGLFLAHFTSRFVWPLYIAFLPCAVIGVENLVDSVSNSFRRDYLGAGRDDSFSGE